MAKFKFGVLLNPYAVAKTARLGDGAGVLNPLSKADNGKFAKLVGDSQYGLCAVGDQIEAEIGVVDDIPPADGYIMGSLNDGEGTRVLVTFDGLQATPGTGTLVLGDYVVAGTPVVRGTGLLGVAPKVCKSTDLTFATTPAVTFPSGTQHRFKWRLVALNGTGAVGQTGVIERVL